MRALLPQKGRATGLGLAGMRTIQLAQVMSPDIIGIPPYRFHKFVSREIIQERVQQVAARLREDYRDKKPVMVGILNGCFIYMADLVREMAIPCQTDFIKLTSYGDEMRPGVITMLKDVDTDLTGRHVIIVEDIVDTGKSLGFLRQHLLSKNPASLVMTAMFMKHCFKALGEPVEYVGMEIPDEFVIGYGLDYAQQWRHLPDLYALVEDK
jgi:hypoxanthine phosphoribosyltransferase